MTFLKTISLFKSDDDDVGILKKEDLKKIHNYSLMILEKTGMKIFNDRMLNNLKKQGASVDFSNHIVKFPRKLIENTINLVKKDYKKASPPKLISGASNESSKKVEVSTKFGGACIQFLDWDKQELIEPSIEELINMLKLGEFLPQVSVVGNPVMFLKDINGNKIDPKMQRIKTAAEVAKYTRKAGPTEVWNAKELDYLIEIGSIVKGNKDEYYKNPCFITAKETISPLILDKLSAETLLALAERDLYCCICAMTLCGASSPVTPLSGVIIANAEILGVFTAIKSLYPNARVCGASINGALDMSTGLGSFGVPEAAMQDISLSLLHEYFYGFDFGQGTCYSDSSYPGAQISIEKVFKFFISGLTGHFNYSVGIINNGKCFSPEQALIDIEIVEMLIRFFKGLKVSDENACIDLINKVGIGGSFLAEEHTLLNFKKDLFLSKLFNKKVSSSLRNDMENDIIKKANIQVKKILSRDDLYVIEKGKETEINRIVEKAEKILLS